MSMEKTLAVLLAAENEARGIVEEAEKEAQTLREQTDKEVQELIAEARSQEEQEFQQLMREARDKVLSARDEILGGADKRAEDWEGMFQQNRDLAIQFIIDRILEG